MKSYDIKHIAYHVLVALYFIWFAIFGTLLALALSSYFNAASIQFTKVLLTWICLNLFMGTALFIVIQQFKRQNVLSRIILYGYFLMAAASVTTVLIIIP